MLTLPLSLPPSVPWFSHLENMGDNAGPGLLHGAAVRVTQPIGGVIASLVLGSGVERSQALWLADLCPFLTV